MLFDQQGNRVGSYNKETGRGMFSHTFFVDERTCTLTWCEDEEGADGWLCSSCDDWFRHAYGNAEPKFCIACGARVVEK